MTESVGLIIDTFWVVFINGVVAIVTVAMVEGWKCCYVGVLLVLEINPSVILCSFLEILWI